jgi:hypothetical protein
MIDIALGKFAGMSAAVKREEAPSPVEVGLFGTATVVLAAQGAAPDQGTVLAARDGPTSTGSCRPSSDEVPTLEDSTSTRTNDQR